MKGPLRLLWTQHRGKDDGMKNNVAFGEKFIVSLNSYLRFLQTISLSLCVPNLKCLKDSLLTLKVPEFNSLKLSFINNSWN